MASKHHYQGDFAEESYSSDDDDVGMPMIEQRPRGRPSKMNSNRLTSDPSSMYHSADNSSAVPRRRGRGPSKRPCSNRNAQMARENRQRKKEYIEKIENRLQIFQKENQELHATIQKQNVEIKRLGVEVKYLKNILENNTHITNLMKAVNESLKKMHGQNEDASEEGSEIFKGLSRPSEDVINWIAGSGQKNNMSLPVSGTTLKIEEEASKKEESNRFSYKNSPPKIARKKMPLIRPEKENLRSNESYYEDHTPLKFSPKSESCEYNTDKSSAGMATTPMSTMSNSMDKCELSLSDTDFSQLSSFDVSLWENYNRNEDVYDPLLFEQDTSGLFNDDTLLYPLDPKDAESIKCQAPDRLELNKASKDKKFFTSSENTGVCLHLNSSRVSLEYCSYCHMNSLNNLNSQIAV